jgi:hypothetical protein
MLFGFKSMEEQNNFLSKKLVYLIESLLEVDCCGFTLVFGVAT